MRCWTADDGVRRVLVVTAHPDDVDFAAAGTVAAFTEAGIEVSYCVVTDGEAGGSDRTVSRADMAALRQEEQRAAAAVVGVRDLWFLGYPDGRVGPTLELRRDISRVIRSVRPQRLITQSPERSWSRMAASHPDHLAVGEAAVCAFYPDAGNPFAHPELLEAEGLEPHTVDELWLMAAQDGDLVVDTTATLEAKRAALLSHRSQIADPTSLGDLLGRWGSATARSAGLPEGSTAESFQVVASPADRGVPIAHWAPRTFCSRSARGPFGSSTPSASKKTITTKPAKVTTTTAAPTTTTTAPTASTTTVTTVAKSTATVVTTTAPAAPSAPGGSLSANLTTSPAGTLTGVGASSIQPFYGRVFYQYNLLNKGVSINYSPAGSGPGVTAIQQNTATFGQSEIPMTSAQLAAAKGPVIQVPVDLGGVAISYNESCAGAGLHLTGAQIAGIYLGTITNWNQSAACPTSAAVVPVFRADTSGPGYDLDQYLIDTAGATWTSAIGTSSPSTTWPTAARSHGTGQQLNTGVASYIQSTAGAIGYVEYSYALAANFANAALQNKGGAFVTPSIASIGEAGANAAHLSASNFNIVYSGGASTYPLANFSWALLYQKQASTNVGIDLGKLFQWVITTGQTYSNGLGYAQLPANAVAYAHSELLGLQTASGQSIFSS